MNKLKFNNVYASVLMELFFFWFGTFILLIATNWSVIWVGKSMLGCRLTESALFRPPGFYCPQSQIPSFVLTGFMEVTNPLFLIFFFSMFALPVTILFIFFSALVLSLLFYKQINKSAAKQELKFPLLTRFFYRKAISLIKKVTSSSPSTSR